MFATVFLVCELAAADAMLRIRPRILAQPNSDVKLSQLVDGQGLSTELTNKLNSVSLSVAPAYGEKQEIANANLSAILRPLIQAERARGAGSLHVVIPKSVVIDTTKREMDSELVKMELKQAWQPLCSDCQLEVEALSLPKISEIRDWTLRLKPELPRGSFSVPVDIVRENGSPTMAWVSGRLLQKRKVPVAKRAFNQGERIMAQDFAIEFRDTSYALDGVPAAEELTGKRLKQGLRAGDTLWKGMIERERAVRAGETVQLKSSEGEWEVSLRVIAQQDAYIGDVINLKNPKTNNILMGQVTGQGEVELR
jgi:flagella basal body P-ring formation protein FlgA